MFSPKTVILCSRKINLFTDYFFKKNLNVAIIGATGETGSNLACLLKQNPQITGLQLYDDEADVDKIAMQLNYIPGGPIVTAFNGDHALFQAVQYAKLIVMVSSKPKRAGLDKEQLLALNGPSVHKVCRAVAENNCGAFFALSINPLNSMVPLASTYFYKYCCYNLNRLFGITQIDAERSRAYTGKTLEVDSSSLFIPVIGGHSDESIIPLLSNMSPSVSNVDYCQADTITQLVRKADSDVTKNKNGRQPATLAVAWTICDFVNKMVTGLVEGKDVTVHAMTANPSFGTQYFAGPTIVNSTGIIAHCDSNAMVLSSYEQNLLEKAVPIINSDVKLGENYANEAS